MQLYTPAVYSRPGSRQLLESSIGFSHFLVIGHRDPDKASSISLAQYTGREQMAVVVCVNVYVLLSNNDTEVKSM